MGIKMNRSAVLHIPISEYAYGVDEEHVTFRLRCGRGDLEHCFLHFGDRACRQTPVIFTKQEMVVAASDEYFDYYEITLEHPYKRINYYFELISEDESTLYYGDCFMEECVDDRSEYYQLPFNHRADLVKPPAWAKDAVIYNIFPDSFATEKESISLKSAEKEMQGELFHGKLGGTIRGITENVNYLKDLGINAIYINPVFAAGEYHKYDLVDYFHIDPCFGTNEEFKEMVKVYHENGMKVIVDGVFNHCGWRFFAFNDVVEKGESSRYKDWFYRLTFPVVRPENGEIYPDYECFGYERMMPKLNGQNPEVIDYFCQVCRYWLKEYEIDGWRLDVASEMNDEFWNCFCRAAKEVNPDAILIGEVWETARHWLDGKKFDSTMNYDFRKHCRRFFAEESIDAFEFDGRVTNMRMRYREQTVYAQLNLLDSHDVSRFLSLCGNNEKRYRLAVLFQMTFPGVPSVFYGDERGIDGILEEEYRAAMPWQKEKDDLFAFYQIAIRLRREHETLRNGKYRTIQADKGDRLYIYAREFDSDKIVIAINGNNHMSRLPQLFMDAQILWQEGLWGETPGEKSLLPMGFAVARI